MNIFLTIFIFSLVLFLYLHIYFHLKVSNDLEVYTIEQPSKDKLEEVCDLRQPVIFDFENTQLKESCNLASLEDVYGAFDIKIRNIEDDNDDTKEMYLPFLLKEAVHLFQNDEKKVYISENNTDFLKETGTLKVLKYNDAFLRPHMVSKCIYDILSGSIGCQTPLRYNLNYRNYIYLTNGSARLKLIPPQSGRYLDVIKDYDNFEYRSPVNPWNVQERYKPDFDKIKVLDLDIIPGQMIFIPAYWWYSIEYVELSCICSFQYRTYMNTLAILPELVLSLLQKQNIKRDAVKKVDSE
ncbi:hypothetical protein [uncultured Mediterranean phage]|nr:hypothetical protein [uncultured Mediterranean phage]